MYHGFPMVLGDGVKKPFFKLPRWDRGACLAGKTKLNCGCDSSQAASFEVFAANSRY